jgi:holin-like protein
VLAVFGLLLFCQLLGEVITRGLGIPLPGPVLGLCLLTAMLFMAERTGHVSRQTVDHVPIGRVTAGLLGVLGLLFVPAGVGLTEHWPLFREYGLALLIAILGSTLLTLLVTVGVFLGVAKLSGKPAE